eukprot:TRINITY_DN629_c0_g1_i4.p1 TRINITY_DN629_c0_g1~~TRINITY_DN629_c0_g1_i4.p1  ORF type:complete len:450 (+),score=72.96 TRINITY_DN629_c0_g1_i4:1032-2381(+)
MQNYIRSYSTLPSYLVNTPPTKVTILPSGVKVASASGSGEIATVGIWIDAGSSNETEFNSGVANFLQSVALRGTSQKSKQQLYKEIENIGASLIGNTTREYTSFVVQSSKSDVPHIIQILSEIVKNTNFKEDQIERIRTLILKKQQYLRSTIEDSMIDIVHSAAYQGTSYALAPIGEPSTVKAIKEADLVDFQKQHYVSSNILVVGTGPVIHDQLLSLTSNNLYDISTATPNQPPSPQYMGSEIRIRDDTIRVVKTFFGYDVVGREHAHHYSFLVLQKLLSNWSRNGYSGIYPSSRLAETIALEKLCYEYRTVYIPYRKSGLFGVYSETGTDNIEDLTYEIFNEIQKFSTYVTSHELSRAKNQLKGEVLTRYLNSSLSASDIAESVLHTGRAISVVEAFSRIDAIELSDIQSVLDTYLTDVDPVVVSHGPTENLPDYNIIRGWTYWNRW